MTTLETPRLLLRPFREEDLDAYAALYADPEVTGHMGGPFDRAAAWRSMAICLGHQQLRGYSPSAVVEKETGRLVGRGGLWKPEGWPGLEVSWLLPRWAWGRGYATELGMACRDHAFTELGAERLISVIRPGNAEAVAVALRIGHRLIGQAKLDGNMCLVFGQDAPKAPKALTAALAPAWPEPDGQRGVSGPR